MKQFSFLLLLLVVLPFPGFAETVLQYDFNDKAWGNLAKGSYWTMQPAGGVGNSSAVRLEYSQSGTPSKALALNTAALKSNVFQVEFDVKTEGTPSGGCKFIKFFGSTSTHSQNNMTIGLDYYGNVQKEVAYYMDTICTARWDGTNAGSCRPTHLQTSGPIDIRGGNWGRFKVWLKRATPGQRDGEVKVWWNGDLRAHIANMDSNPQGSATDYFEAVEIGGYNHSNFSGKPWYLWVDNLTISTPKASTESTPPPPVANPSPQPPDNLKVITIED